MAPTNYSLALNLSSQHRYLLTYVLYACHVSSMRAINKFTYFRASSMGWGMSYSPVKIESNLFKKHRMLFRMEKNFRIRRCGIVCAMCIDTTYISIRYTCDTKQPSKTCS